MKIRLPHRWFAALLCCAACLPVHAQQPAATSAPGITLRARARLVVVDVSVTDSHHNPVHHLPKSDFALIEGKASQTITSFEEHAALSAAEAAKFEPLPALAPGIFTNYIPTPVNSAVNVLLLDALNTPLADQQYVRSQLLDYLKNARPGTSVAIFGLSTQLRMLQGFTSDPAVLKSIVLKQGGNASPMLQDAVGGGGMPDTITDTMADMGSLLPAEVIANMQTFENMQQSMQLQMRAKYTLDALNELARFLADIPGRKNLIWFSGSFPINILPDTSGTASDPFAAVASSEAEYRETTNLLARSQVAVFPIDARGLMVSPVFSAESTGSKYTRNPARIGQDESKFGAQLANEHSTMRRMAEDTGGAAYVNTNGLSQAVGKAIDAGSNYYTLAYTPTDTKWKGDFRKIQVKLAQGGYTLNYRRGYYADDPDSPTTALAAAPAANTDRSAVMRAIAHGVPGATEIIFKLRVLPASTSTEDTLAPGNTSGPAKPAGPFRRFLVDFAADARSFTFRQSADGVFHCSFEFLTVVYNRDGQPLVSLLNPVKATLTAARYAAVLRTGIPMHQEISVPGKDGYSIRILVHDLASTRIGATEIAVAAVKNLPPPPPPAASPATPPTAP